MKEPWGRLLVLAGLIVLGCGVAPERDGGGVARTPIINGQLDQGQYPQVGTFVRRNPLPGGPWQSRCTGTLIAENVFLTAAHCIVNARDAGAQYGQYGVSFDPVFVPSTSKVILGTGYEHPDFTFETPIHDVGIVVLDEPVLDLTPKKLISGIDRLERMDPQELAEAEIVTVGYGFDAWPARTGRGTRRVAVQHFLQLWGPEWGAPFYNWVMLGGPFEEGNGTTCVGDSGGPHFLDDRIMAVTSQADCGESGAALEWAQRVDLKPVHQFIMSFLED